MNELVKAKEELRSSNFKKALEHFKKLLISKNHSQEVILESCLGIESIFKFLNKSVDTETLILLADNWERIAYAEKASASLSELYRRTNNLNYLKRVFSCFLGQGNIESAYEVANLYLQRSFKRGYSYRIKEFIEENERFFEQGVLIEWNLKCFLAAGNKQSLEKFISEAKTITERHFSLILLEIEKNTRYWHSSPVLLDVLLDYYEKTKAPVNRKHLVKTVFDAWLLLEKDFELINKTLLIAKRHSLNIFGHELSKVLGKTNEMEYFAKRETPETLNLQSLDLGIDLLVEPSDGQEERNIKFLLRMGLREEALKQVESLRKKDPDNLFVKALSDKEITVEESKGTNLDSLIKDIRRFGSKQEQAEISLNEYKNITKFYNKGFIEENYEDMAIGFNLVNLPQVAYEVLRQVELEARDIKEQVNIVYLKAETLFRMEEFFKVRDIVDDALGEFPLSVLEKVSLVYLRAEAYFRLEDFENAFADFSFVRSKIKNYRLTEERIRGIEKNK